MSELDTIFPKYEEITVEDRKYKIGKLSFLQVTELALFLKDVLPKLGDKIKKGNTTTNHEDFLTIIHNVEPAEVTELFSILVGEKEKKFVERYIITDGVLCSDILMTICERNDFKKLFGNFLRAMALIK